MSNYNWSDDEPGPDEPWDVTYLKALGAVALTLVCLALLYLFA